MGQDENFLSPESLPTAALFFYCPATTLYCDVYQLCRVMANVKHICASIERLKFVPQSGGLFNKTVERALIEMERAGFLRIDWQKDRIDIVRTMAPPIYIHDKFFAEISRQEGFVSSVRNFQMFGEVLADRLSTRSGH